MSTEPAAPVAAEGTPPPPPPPPATVTMRELVDAGAHFGHQTQRWHPNMKPFLYGERNGIHIIDLQQTLPRVREALEFVKELVADGGRVLFVSTKRQAQEIVAETAQAVGMPFVHRRWLGGMLTNFRTVRKGVERYQELIQILGDEERLGQLTKKERSKLSREHLKLHKAFEGISDMERLPDAMFVIDIRREAIALQEAKRLGIPVIAIVDSNCDPAEIEYSIPGNDDAQRAIRLYCQKISEACLLGEELFQSRVLESDQEKPPVEEEERPTLGKRVVEITQPARRPARMERLAQERRAEAKREEQTDEKVEPDGQDSAPTSADGGEKG